MKIVLDTTILVRAHERSHGAARKSCPLDPLVLAPIRDVNDIIVMQTAIIGEADILCTMDEDFFESPASEYLRKMNIAVLDDIALMQRLRSMR